MQVSIAYCTKNAEFQAIFERPWGHAHWNQPKAANLTRYKFLDVKFDSLMWDANNL